MPFQLFSCAKNLCLLSSREKTEVFFFFPYFSYVAVVLSEFVIERLKHAILFNPPIDATYDLCRYLFRYYHITNLNEKTGDDLLAEVLLY